MLNVFTLAQGRLVQQEIDRLQANARWQRKDDRWDVPQWSLQIKNPDLQGEWQGQWQASADGTGPGVLHLQGQINQVQAARVHRYLPTNLSASVRQYVRDAGGEHARLA